MSLLAGRILSEVESLLGQRKTAPALSLLDALRRDAWSDPAVLMAVSILYGRAGRLRLSRETALRAVALSPAAPDVRYGLSRLLGGFSEHAALVGCLDGMNVAEHASPQAIGACVMLLVVVGEQELARAYVNTGLRRFPDHPVLHYVGGNLALFSGEKDRAEQHYEAALAMDPRLFQASWMLADVRKQTEASNHVDRLRRQLADAAPGGMGQIHLQFALFKELDDLGETAAAWQALTTGCRAKRAMQSFDIARARTAFSLLRERYSAEIPVVSPPPAAPAPIFIVGMHRSGTSLAEDLLSTHPQITTAGETYSFVDQLRIAADGGLRSRIDPAFVAAFTAATPASIADDYRRLALHLARGRPFFTEKLPSNFLYIGAIAKTIPEARFVHLVRDPVATCFSNFRVLFGEGCGYSYDQSELANYYIEYKKLMAHWHRILPGRILDVPYDQLAANPNGSKELILAHCGIADALQPDGTGIARRSVVTASASRLRDGIQLGRDAAWLPYAAYLQPLRNRLAEAGL